MLLKITTGLQIFLETFLPIEIAKIQRRKYVSEYDLALLHGIPDLLCAKGDVLQFGGVKGEAGSIAGQFCKALALAFFDIDDTQKAILNTHRAEQIAQWVNQLNLPSPLKRSSFNSQKASIAGDHLPVSGNEG